MSPDWPSPQPWATPWCLHITVTLLISGFVDGICALTLHLDSAPRCLMINQPILLEQRPSHAVFINTYCVQGILKGAVMHELGLLLSQS